MPKDRRVIAVNGEAKLCSHIVWHAATGHWPVSPEVIHHIDGDSTNDSFINLRLMSDSEHKRLHAQGVIPPSPLGRIHTEESKVKMSVSKIGDKNPNWQGDDASPRVKRRRELRAQRRAEQI